MRILKFKINNPSKNNLKKKKNKINKKIDKFIIFAILNTFI